MSINPNSDVLHFFNNVFDEDKVECKICNVHLRNNSTFILRKHMHDYHTSESVVWIFFENISEAGVAVCNLCQRRIRNNRYYNFSIHLKSVHNIDLNSNENLGKYKATNNESESKRKEQASSVPTAKRANNCLYVNMKEKTLVRSVLRLMLNDGVAPQAFGSRNMQALLKPICESFHTNEKDILKIDEIEAERALCSLATHIHKKLSNNLHWRLLSLKIDIDSNISGNLFFLSALFIKDGEFQSHALGLIDHENKTCITEENIKKVLHKFSIDSDQIVSAFWDDTKLHHCKQVDNSDYLHEIQNFESVNEISLGGIKVERYIGYTAQLCILDLFKNPNIFEPFLQCRNLVKFINEKSNHCLKAFNDYSFNIPQLDSPWKWGSTYTMIKYLNEARNVLKGKQFVYKGRPQDSFKLDDNVWDFIDAYCKTISCVQKILIKYNSENMHFGDFYANWLKCKLSVIRILKDSKDQNNHTRTIATGLMESIKIRSSKFLEQERFVACLYLDPRFQHTLNTQQKIQAQSYLKELWARSKIYKTDTANSPRDMENKDEELLIPDFDDDDDTFLNNYLSQHIKNVDERTQDVHLKLETLKLNFKNTNTNILKFWMDQAASEPEIYAISEICFAIPATQVYGEVQYSQLYKNQDHKNLSKLTKEDLLSIHLNVHVVENMIEENSIDELNLFRTPDTSSNNEEFIDLIVVEDE